VSYNVRYCVEVNGETKSENEKTICGLVYKKAFWVEAGG